MNAGGVATTGGLFWQHIGRNRWKVIRHVTRNGKRTTEHVGYVARRGQMPE
jgi:hypothetical protein